ncbi:GPI ethanolamine phosphate transferase 2 [Colletotrichum liriopes]|uniref:GPI ethanolamine phosphate transferase 2 n=1 Tax=Colletotrichum liriopes TaxID=708192 RepID=A0AA37GQV2_9PEZI|nr:GPI ethanolamine phosphate transferase 2 [Colletotrichum liriopes]
MYQLKQNILLIAANLLVPVAVLVYAAGFFRYKPSLFVPDIRHETFHRHSTFPESPPFDKVIVMVVDALRSLIRSGAAIPFTAHAGPPSLTITRIKAMTTGSNPSFVDLFLNLADDEAANTLSDEDTWLARLKSSSRGKKLVFYGENTWLQLFPNIFDRSEGTHAFYVPDFTEVDNNVTRHIAHELPNDDWSALVVHFSGLDHVGHVGGPQR